MRKVFRAFFVFLLCASSIAAVTPVSLISFSVKVSPATAEDPLTDLEWSLSLSSVSRAGSPNGEMLLADEDVPYTHQGYFVLVDPITGEPAVLPFVLDVPLWVDNYERGLPDFYDRELPVDDQVTEGAHPTFDGKAAQFTARWNRFAGDDAGRVTIDLPFFGLRFVHDYLVPSYSGQYNYTRTNSSFSGAVQLTNRLASTDVISGPWSLTLTNASRLGYVSGTWDGTAGTKFPFEPLDSLDRTGTNYVTILGMHDGEPATSDADYQLWFMVIHSSDSNANGVLDFVEESAPSATSTLEIARTNNSIQITAHGAPGKSYILESAGTLPSPTWSTVETIQLTGASATVTVPSDGRAKFFRLRDG